MTGLADAYQDDVGALQSHTRLQAGVALLAGGTLLCLLALVVAVANPTAWGARRLAGVLVGLAAPALAGGVVVILPASPRLRAAAAIGASLTVLGVAAFWRAYPEHWMGHGRELTPYVTGIYFLGMLTIALCLFAGIATFKRRNDPGGTVSLVVGEGETKVVQVEGSGGLGGLGGVGLLGGTPEGDVETQTNRPESAEGTGGASSASASRTGTSSRSGTETSSRSGTGTSSRSGTGTSSRSGTETGWSSDAGGSSGASADATGTFDDGASVETVGTGGRFQSSSSDLDATSHSPASGSASSSSSSYGSTDGTYGSSTDTYGASTDPIESSTAGTDGPSTGSSSQTGEQSAVSDGGSGPEPLHRPKGDTDPATSPEAADRYCGNCEHFSYVKTDQGMTPYCGFTSEYMEDVEACEDWSPNAGRR